MPKYLLILIILLTSFSLFGQNPKLKKTSEVDLETEFIVAMQDVALEEYDNALEKLKKIKNKIHNDGIVEFEIARIHFKQNRIDEALKYVKKAIEKDDTKLIYKQFLIDILIEQKDFQSVAETMESILDKSSFERAKYFSIAEYYQRAKNTKKSIKTLENLEKITGFDREIELYKSNIYLRNRDYKMAFEVLDNLLKKIPNDIKTLESKALIYRLQNNKDKALEIYNMILSIDADNPKAISFVTANKRFNESDGTHVDHLTPMLKNPKIELDKKIKTLIPFVAKVSPTNHLKNQMINAAKILIEQYPQDAKTHALYADILYNSGDLEESLKHYEKSLEYNKNNFTIWKQIMMLYTLSGSWEKLAKLSENAIDYYPNQASGYYNAGRAYVNLNKVNKGLVFLDEALLFAGKNNKFKSEIFLMKAKGFILDRKISKAMKILEDIDENFKLKHPFYWELKGDIEMDKGQLEQAKKMWEKSLKLGNNSKRLINKLKL